MNEIEMMRVKEAAAWLRVHPSTLYREVQRGRIPVVRIGRMVLIRKADLVKYVEGALSRVS